MEVLHSFSSEVNLPVLVRYGLGQEQYDKKEIIDVRNIEESV